MALSVIGASNANIEHCRGQRMRLAQKNAQLQCSFHWTNAADELLYRQAWPSLHCFGKGFQFKGSGGNNKDHGNGIKAKISVVKQGALLAFMRMRL